MFDHGQYDFHRSKQSCLQKLSEKHPMAQVSSVSLVDEANSVDHIVLFPIMLSYSLSMVPSSIIFLSSWHCSMSKTANYWPFIKTFKKNMHRNKTRFSWCCVDSLKRESWTGPWTTSQMLQESVYYYFGGPNKLFATWFQLEEPSRFAEKEQIFGNRLVVGIFFAEGKTWT